MNKIWLFMTQTHNTFQRLIRTYTLFTLMISRWHKNAKGGLFLKLTFGYLTIASFIPFWLLDSISHDILFLKRSLTEITVFYTVQQGHLVTDFTLQINAAIAALACPAQSRLRLVTVLSWLLAPVFTLTPVSVWMMNHSHPAGTENQRLKVRGLLKSESLFNSAFTARTWTCRLFPWVSSHCTQGSYHFFFLVIAIHDF